MQYSALVCRASPSASTYSTSTPSDVTSIFRTAAPNRWVPRIAVRQRVRDPVHATDRLEHRHRLVPLLVERERQADPGGQQVGEGVRRVQEAGLVGGTWRLGVPAGASAAVPVAPGQAAEAAEVLDQRLLVVRGQDVVQRALPTALGQQLSDVAVEVGLGGPPAYRTSGQRAGRALCLVVQDERVGVGIDEDLDGHASSRQ